MTEASGRVLPELTDLTEFFWKSGEDGKLRFQRCADCGELRHPPSAVCPYCRSTEWSAAEVSGRGVVAGFTYNEQMWIPSFPPPYLIAIVAIDEDDRIRLTTNLVNVDADDVFVGMKVQVTFEHDDDVWIPLFEPTGETDKGPFPAEDPKTYDARPMPKAGDKFEDKVAVTGIGMSRIGRRLMVDPVVLAVEAAEQAIADAGLTVDDIDGLSTYPGGSLSGGMTEGGIYAMEEALRVRPSWINGGLETPGQGGAVIAAMLAVAGGLCKHVLCFRTVWQSTYDALLRNGALKPGGGGRIGGDMGWSMPFGATSAAHTLAQTAQRHFHKYGTTRETLGWIALNQRANAALEPTAVYRDPLTMDDYLGARPITTPFGLYDCDVPCDGAVAVIVSAAETAGDLRVRPVRVEAVGTQIVERLEWDQSTSTHEPQVLGPAAHLWTRTDLRPDDVDVAELYDGFTFNCLSWIEALGFCGLGEAKDFLEGGKNIARDGVLPLNTHGGQLSHGRTHGMGLVHEAIVQLRGEAGDRQVGGARVAVVSSGGLTPSGVMLLRSEA